MGEWEANFSVAREANQDAMLAEDKPTEAIS
jgi:hypothetical protein